MPMSGFLFLELLSHQGLTRIPLSVIVLNSYYSYAACSISLYAQFFSLGRHICVLSVLAVTEVFKIDVTPKYAYLWSRNTLLGVTIFLHGPLAPCLLIWL